MPVKPSYVKFAKVTPSARFLKFCKVGTRGNYCKKKARKKKPRANAELCQICQGDPQRAFSEILQSWDQGKLLQKEGQKKHPGANAIMS